jgi:hypothetical protein
MVELRAPLIAFCTAACLVLLGCTDGTTPTCGDAGNQCGSPSPPPLDAAGGIGEDAASVLDLDASDEGD